MIPVEISDAADADLVDILAYGMAMFGVEQAEAYLRGFDASFDLIAEHPAIGAVHNVVRPPIRSLPHGSHRIFYDIFSERILVQRVLHQSVDIERHL